MFIDSKTVTTADQLVKAVEELCFGIDLSTVYIQRRAGKDADNLILELHDRRLTDNSKVYDLIIY